MIDHNHSSDLKDGGELENIDNQLSERELGGSPRNILKHSINSLRYVSYTASSEYDYSG